MMKKSSLSLHLDRLLAFAGIAAPSEDPGEVLLPQREFYFLLRFGAASRHPPWVWGGKASSVEWWAQDACSCGSGEGDFFFFSGWQDIPPSFSTLRYPGPTLFLQKAHRPCVLFKELGTIFCQQELIVSHSAPR